MKSKNILYFAIVMINVVITGCTNVVSLDDCCPPRPPSGVYSITGDETIELYWDPNRENDVAGYYVYRSFSLSGYYERIGATRSTAFIDRDLQNGVTHFYAISAYNYHGVESDLNNDIVYDTPRPEGYAETIFDYVEDPYHSGFNFVEEIVQLYSRTDTDFYLEYDFTNNIWYLNVPDPKTWFIEYGYVSSLKQINTAPEKGWSDQGWFELTPGWAYIFWTWNNHFAVIRVSSLGRGWCIFDWAYQTDPGNPELDIKRDDHKLKPATTIMAYPLKVRLKVEK